MRMFKPLENKIILVTGASGGIGCATCMELANLGATVILQGRNREQLEETRKKMPECESVIITGDLTDLTIYPVLIEDIFKFGKRLDGVAFCAGTAGMFKLGQTAPEILESRMSINCFSFIELVRQIMKKKKKGDLLQIVAISSLAALGQDKYLTAYAASKGALEAAAKSLAYELMPKNVRINLIRCAFVETPMTVSVQADPMGDFAQRLQESGYQPLGLIPPQNIAELACFLLSPTSLYTTGSVFSISGGAKI